MGRDAIAIVTSYLTSINRHEPADALEHLSDSFRLEFVDGPVLTRAQMTEVLGWDAATHAAVVWSVVSDGADWVRVRGSETNEFLASLDVPPLAFVSRFEIDSEGRIDRQQHELQWTGPALGERLSPLVEWARGSMPQALAEAFPDGRMVYSERTGRLWLDMVRRWQAES